jgi:hypothetical protein
MIKKVNQNTVHVLHHRRQIEKFKTALNKKE